jgi:hypothetical protein
MKIILSQDDIEAIIAEYISDKFNNIKITSIYIIDKDSTKSANIQAEIDIINED